MTPPAVLPAKREYRIVTATQRIAGKAADFALLPRVLSMVYGLVHSEFHEPIWGPAIMAASVLDQIKNNLTKARGELNAKRKDIEQQINSLQKQLDALDSDFALLDRLSGRAPRGGGRGRGGRGSRKLGYGGVRTSVL